MKLYSYVVVHVTGFAPNPYWGYCTLAACTPNHLGIRPELGDWIIGTEPKSKGNKLVYAMQVNEVLSFQDYFTDSRFQAKKPLENGTPRQRCGDNIYFKNSAGEWEQYGQAIYHRETEARKQDLKHPYVFIADHFYYFGKRALPIPQSNENLILKRQGVKCKHNPDDVNSFLKWLCEGYQPGLYGKPITKF